MRLARRAAHGVDDRVDLVPLAQRVERWKCETDRVPESGHDQLLAAGGLDRREELGVLGVIWSSVFGSRIARLVMSVSSNLGFDWVCVMIELSTL